MTDKELKEKVADIIMEAIEEYNNNDINRPMIASLYSNKIISFFNSLPEEPVSKVWHDASETPIGAADRELLVQFTDYHTSVVEVDDWEYLDHQTKWAYLSDLLKFQEPVEWSEEDKRCWINAISACEQAAEDYDHSQEYIDASNWLKSLRPQK